MSGVGSRTWVQIDRSTALIRRTKNPTSDCLLVQTHREESLLVSCCAFHWNTLAHLFHLPDALSEGTGKSVIDSEEGEPIESGTLSASAIQVGS